MSLAELGNSNVRPNAYLGTTIASSVNANGGVAGSVGAISVTCNDVSAPAGTSGLEIAAIGAVDGGGYGDTNVTQIRVLAKPGQAARGTDFASIVIPTTDAAVPGMDAGDIEVNYSMIVEGDLTVNGTLNASDRNGIGFEGGVAIPASATTVLFNKEITYIPPGEVLVMGYSFASPTFTTTAGFTAANGVSISIVSRNSDGDVMSSCTWDNDGAWPADSTGLTVEPSTNSTENSDFNGFLILTPSHPIITLSVTCTAEVSGVQAEDENPIFLFPVNMSVFGTT